jgi:integrase
LLGSLRIFLSDIEEWGWIERRFDPSRYLATPRTVRALIGPDPRVIQDDSWAKLLWAGLNLSAEDLPRPHSRNGLQADVGAPFYPLEMVKAMVIVWLFSGLRRSEFRRLRVGCIRWQREEIAVHETGETITENAICWLQVPVHKTGTAFTKGVDHIVGEAISAWEQVRPPQPSHVDQKTGEVVNYLFSYRGGQVGNGYLNRSLIPLLCRKGGVPLKDARGNITSHRARSTIASQLFNAKEPMSLFELQEWLGHRWASSTQSYAKLKPTKVAKSWIWPTFGDSARLLDIIHKLEYPSS